MLLHQPQKHFYHRAALTLAATRVLTRPMYRNRSTSLPLLNPLPIHLQQTQQVNEKLWKVPWQCVHMSSIGQNNLLLKGLSCPGLELSRPQALLLMARPKKQKKQKTMISDLSNLGQQLHKLMPLAKVAKQEQRPLPSLAVRRTLQLKQPEVSTHCKYNYRCKLVCKA